MNIQPREGSDSSELISTETIAIVDGLFEVLDVDFGGLLRIEPAHLQTLYSRSKHGGLEGFPANDDINPYLLWNAMRRGRPTFVDVFIHGPELWQPLSKLGVTALAFVPFTLRASTILAAILISFTPGRVWTDVEREFLRQTYTRGVPTHPN
ncbi:GAF domain-containing protein [Deinococcus hopiensis]|uniref:GAF domain-containing protein n=1 Tax=Deinococcus hopiensis KR-140 TaxID=695939 RepID=A0A1W1UYB6_9DEIO|nr:GAF domain-containing protein [Deinococcus hopiensis]SMB86049.1 GAF domain-containing protein [Deinococcus hopiensis KR-140]